MRGQEIACYFVMDCLLESVVLKTTRQLNVYVVIESFLVLAGHKLCCTINAAFPLHGFKRYLLYLNAYIFLSFIVMQACDFLALH